MAILSSSLPRFHSKVSMNQRRRSPSPRSHCRSKSPVRRRKWVFRLVTASVVLFITWQLCLFLITNHITSSAFDWSTFQLWKSKDLPQLNTSVPGSTGKDNTFRVNASRSTDTETGVYKFDPTIDDILQVWQWEISSGHYPSQALPDRIAARLSEPINNPALPNATTNGTQTRKEPSTFPIVGTGSPRRYIDPRTIARYSTTLRSTPPSLFPQRPPPGSIVDLDMIMQNCDYKDERGTRDCLEFLRIGAGLDDINLYFNEVEPVQSSYIYLEEGSVQDSTRSDAIQTTNSSLLTFPPPLPYHTYSDLVNSKYTNPSSTSSAIHDISISATKSSSLCDPDYPRIFHLFWSGPFTSHPYMMILSFLYTQNLGLSLNSTSHSSSGLVCRPRLWIWIWDPHSLSPDEKAKRDFHRTLASNMWSRPFLHPRFDQIIEFKLWDMPRQLDAMGDALRGWRSVLGVAEEAANGEALKVISEGKVYDGPNPKLLTIISDTARFILTYLYGGIYIDADTLFLRDWEELWGYRGAFAYRWSHIKNEYNTAVLKMDKGSVLGDVLIRAARKGRDKKWWNWSKDDVGMEFHPKEGISKYVEKLDLVLPVEPNGRKGLLWMLPVALFDPAWLATDGYEADRMVTPGFKSFSDFFDTPSSLSHEAELLGLEGFFRGAYSYHWHNQWQVRTSFDKEQDYPNWGNQLADYTRKLEKLYPSLNFTYPTSSLASHSSNPNSKLKRSFLPSWRWPWQQPVKHDGELPWSAIMKRTMEVFIRGEAPNLYGEYCVW